MQARIRAIVVPAALVFAISACSAAPASSTASATASASAVIAGSGAIASSRSPGAFVTPSPASSDAPGRMPPDSVAAVITTDLVVRTKPGTRADSEILLPTLDAPQLLYVLDGPVAASGYKWYLTVPLFPDYLPHGEDPPSGWVAAGGKDGEPWVAPSSVPCPAPDLYAIMMLSTLARLACFGSRELTLEGTTGGCFVSVPASVDPGWLNSVGCSIAPDGYDPQAVPSPGALVLRFADGGGVDADQRVTVTGHFDDPAASTCRSTPGFESDAPAPAFMVLGCRTQFVVTDIQAR